MSRIVAFLRAINVGGRNIKMAELKTIFETLPVQQVQTYIQSGNVMFDIAASKKKNFHTKIENLLEEQLGYPVITILKDLAQMQHIIEQNPFPDRNPDTHQLYVMMLAQIPNAKQREAIAAISSEVDTYVFLDDILYIRCERNKDKSLFTNMLVEKILKIDGTTRNWNTVMKIASLLSKG
ncbi:hypothetical protein COR50_16570 [Chitinophaga caeni]|uniref:DUF1697 domain-containing protein n=1 Tax=Chitinophaga caeni TaxID=2029983 RepID=A0A291QXE6_9BACT|nr:DUF1697 domain-containing protein [Chitinophaga caeni]ATL48646.1 hypothetical protein COR50_16570 [Chitinophaga caeni]